VVRLCLDGLIKFLFDKEWRFDKFVEMDRNLAHFQAVINFQVTENLSDPDFVRNISYAFAIL
jgi:hypothetical protein